MGFLESYKRLEKLCGEIMSDNYGVSAYIEEMIKISQGPHLVSGWDDDLKQLKHYRWVRNQIAHNPNCFEENMCNSADEKWIADFHSRIMNQTDPLTMYRKATQPKPNSVQKKDYKPIYQEKTQNNYNNQKKESKKIGCGACLIIAWAVIIVAAICFVSILLK